MKRIPSFRSSPSPPPGCCSHHPRLRGFFTQILDESTLHGVKYIGIPNLHFLERGFWIIAVLACTVYSVYLANDVYRKFNASPVIISFQPQETSIALIPFPAITLCNVNILKKSVIQKVFEDLKSELKLSNNTLTDPVKDASKQAEHLTHFCMAARSFRHRLNETLYYPNGTAKTVVDKLNDILLKLSNDDNNLEEEDEHHQGKPGHEDFFHKASHTCEDMILKCMWSSKEIDCKEVFFPVHTRHGSCCAFNMMPKYLLRRKIFTKNEPRVQIEKSRLSIEAIEQWEKFDRAEPIREADYTTEIKYPKYQMAGGKPHGLSILVNPELDVYSSCTTNDALGLKMVAHTPVSYPSILEYGVAIPPNAEVFIDIEPEITTADPAVLEGISVEKRGCLLPTDKWAKLESYRFYTSTNCMSECIAKYTYENCSCVRFFMPRNYTQRLCGAKKRVCSEQVRANIMDAAKTDFCSHCWPSCTEMKYKMQMSHFPLRNNENTTFYYNIPDEGIKTASNYSILHMYYGSDSLYAKERKKLYGASELLANAGGLLGLTLGFSIISLVEIIYFFTLRAWFQFRSYKKQNKEANKVLEIPVNPWKNGKMGLLPEIAGPRIFESVYNSNRLNKLKY